MKRIAKEIPKKCELCKKEFFPLSALGRHLGSDSLNWKKRKYCSKSCATRVTAKGNRRVAGHKWNIKDTSKMRGRHPMTEFKKGNPSWLKGKELSDDTKKKISMKNLGKTAWNKDKKCLAIAGANNPAWRGGTTSQNRMDRTKFRKYLQKKIFERDDYTCQICGVRGVDLQVDHIQEWSKYIEQRFNIDNCRTLCAKCHYFITFGKPMPPTVRAWGHNLFKGGTNL